MMNLAVMNFGHWYLPFDLAQGGEQVESFEFYILVLEFFMTLEKKITSVNRVSYLFK